MKHVWNRQSDVQEEAEREVWAQIDLGILTTARVSKFIGPSESNYKSMPRLPQKKYYIFS